jgi:hypothetical protein
MNKRVIVPFCLATVFAAALPALAASNSDSTTRAGTPEVARVMSRLEQARKIDLMNSRSYTGGENSDAGVFYYRKAQEIDSLMNRLQEGQAVPASEVRSALDNSHAVRYGGSF